MLIHVFDDTPHHYIPMKEFFSIRCAIKYEQVFLARKPVRNEGKQKSSEGIQFYNTSKEIVERIGKIDDNTQVIFHGVFDIHIWRRLVLKNKASQCSCVFWGAELYRHGKNNRSLKQYLAQAIHALLVKRFHKTVTLNPGDASLVERYLYKKDSAVLPYPLIGLTVDDNTEAIQNRPLKIMLGNSAAESNEHIYALQQLSHLKDNNVEVITPLNYAGSDNYVQSVITRGTEIFGDRFVPITNMLTKCQYDNLLKDIDLTVFAHQRQQGLYVAYAMLLMGKPIFIPNTTSSFDNLTSLGFNIFTTQSLSNFSYEELATNSSKPDQHNKSLMQSHFTEKALAPKWSSFANGLFVK